MFRSKIFDIVSWEVIAATIVWAVIIEILIVLDAVKTLMLLGRLSSKIKNPAAARLPDSLDLL